MLRKARGIRGEITAEAFGAKAERFENLQSGYLIGPDGVQKPVQVESAWEHQGRLVLKFRGVDAMSAAEELEGLELRIPKEDRPPAREGEFYFSDLIGCEVVEKNGRVVGKVENWEEFGPTPLLVVDGKYIPFAKSICVEIDVAAKRIVIDPPEGLLEL